MNMGMLVPPGSEEQVDEAQQALIDGLRPWYTGTTPPNFLGSGATQPRRVRAAYSDADYERLSAIKAAHDPRNLFRINHNIPPSGGASADGIVDPRPSRQVGSEEGAG
jgi:hypothetical protein